jgi:hypothetical protein
MEFFHATCNSAAPAAQFDDFLVKTQTQGAQ